MADIEQLYQQHIKLLSPTEMRQLVIMIETYLTRLPVISEQKYIGEIPRRQWHEIAGTAAYPLVDEDAQDWISRTRLESDKERETQWAGEHECC
jgi:hypothetical protein